MKVWSAWILVMSLTVPGHGYAAEPALRAEAKPEAGGSAARPYMRPALGWGGAVLGEPGGWPTFYRSAFGLGAGASLREWSVGLDFVYFWGSKFNGVDSLETPTKRWDAKMNAFRLAADVGYEVGLGRVRLRPHVLAGVEWRRATIAADEVGVKRAPFVAPALAALLNLKQDGQLAVGVDGRLAALFPAEQVDTQLTGMLVFELQL